MYDNYKYKTTVEIRFADLDAFGHVNNATYLTYVEVARTKYWKQVIKWNWKKTGIVIREVNISYIKPIVWGDKIFIYVRTSKIGNSSFDIEYKIVKREKEGEILCSIAKTTCVAIDLKSKTSTPIPETERRRMIEFEQLH
ncbi:acyl-CoA thioesterase [Pedobacter montanisoli]|uniref:Acyl-CoA thioesterase n=1 Tax=Pedobacter montanisoli TaxID=2923277 RepID=A0ABS9ZY95_9SPHI|nr:thioesterase family protein [Pedobacter montanisoli]MCJ0743264.1 acyl-CoA thioesterase [Pedobacter montanisoli]